MNSSTPNKFVAEECGQAHDISLEQFELSALPHNAAVARERIRAVCERLGFAHLETGEIEVAFGEAMNNAILYGSPHPESLIFVDCCLRRFPPPALSVLVLQVRDQGQGFDPDVIPEADLGTEALGGRGIGLMRALMDEVVLFHTGKGMVVRMARRLPPAKDGV